MKSLFLSCPPLQHAQHGERGIEHTAVFKDHLVEGVQRQSTGRICMLQRRHGRVEAVGLVAQRRLFGCYHFNSLLEYKQNYVNTRVPFSLQKRKESNGKCHVACLSHFLWGLA